MGKARKTHGKEKSKVFIWRILFLTKKKNQLFGTFGSHQFDDLLFNWSSKVPSNKTLTECYETHVVPHLQKVVNEQDRTYQSVATRRIKVEQWYRYLILREFRKRRR